jgi:hypothetical protein
MVGFGSVTTTSNTAGSNDALASAAIYSNLFYGINSIYSGDLVAPGSTNILAACAGHSTSSCQWYVYGDFDLTVCAYNTASTFQAMLNTIPSYTGLLHIANNPPNSLSNLETNSSSGGACGGIAGPNKGTNGLNYRTNPGDSATNSWMTTNVWGNTSIIPTGAASERDDFNLTYNANIWGSSEYGSVNWWNISSNSNHAATSYDASLALSANAMAPLHFIANGLSGEVNPCLTVSGGHCLGGNPYSHNFYDNQNRLSDLCSGLSQANMDSLIAEELIYGAGPSGNGFVAYQISAFLHDVTTLALGHTSDNCANAHPMVLDLPNQASYIRTDMLAIKWLACYSSGAPTNVLLYRYTYGATHTEVSVWPEDQMVPYGCEEPITSVYGFNGTTINQGTQCENVGDTGDLLAIIAGPVTGVGCPTSTTPIYGQQYAYMNMNGSNQGNVAVYLNTDTSAHNLVSGNFVHDPITAYKYEVTLVGDELGSAVPFASASGGTIPMRSYCSNVTYCNGELQLEGTVFKGDGTDSIPARSAVILYGPLSTLNQYVYHGCNIYEKNDVMVNTDITNAPVDPNSATMIANAPTGTFDAGNNQGDEKVNLGTSATPQYTVARNGGHTPPLYNSTTAPWVNGWFIEPLSDGHSVSLLTDTCQDYEMYQTTWNNTSSQLAAYDGQANDETRSWQSQMVNTHDAVKASGIPLLGTVYYGEDASLSAINHAGTFEMPTGKDYSQYGYVHPATYPSDLADTGCSGSACPHPFHNGDLIRLKASFNCSVYTTKGQLICNALKHYGAYLDDQASQLGFRFGMTTGGVQAWNYTTDLHPFLSAITLSNFDVINEPQILCLSGTLGSGCY